MRPDVGAVLVAICAPFAQLITNPAMPHRTRPRSTMAPASCRDTRAPTRRLSSGGGLAGARGLDPHRLAFHLRDTAEGTGHRRCRLLVVPRSPLQQRDPASTTASSMPACRSPSSAKRSGIVAMVKSRGVAPRDLVPGARRGHAGVAPGPYRVGGGDGAVAGVLVEVEEHLLAALLLPPLRRDEVGHPPLELAAERQRRPAHLGERPSRLDADVDVDAAVAGRLGPADHAELVEHLAHHRDAPSARRRSRCPAAGRGRGASRPAARCRPAATATGGSRWCRC